MMRLALALCLFSAVLLAGCSSGYGGCSTCSQGTYAPAYGSASAPTTAYAPSSRGVIIRESEPYYDSPRYAYPVRQPVVAREAARPASVRSVARFVPPAAPVLPTPAIAVARPAAPRAVRCAPRPVCKPVCKPKPACAPSNCCPGGNCGIPSLKECCPGGNCGIPSLNDCCPGGNCGVPSFDVGPCSK